jgi:murein DD-endopeptidase MepM/ murein hydrolase activator NlpD
VSSLPADSRPGPSSLRRAAPEPPKREREEVRVRAALSRAVPFVAALAASVPAAAPAAAEPDERTLERGDRGDDVRALQDLLTRLDLPTDADGVFGASTVAHVRTYERREDLSVDGRVSPGPLHGMQRRADEPPAMRPPGSPGGDTPLPAAEPSPPPNEPDPGPAGTYPVDGAHHYGDGFGDRGGEHKGQDVMADCGTPLRAVRHATVRRVATEAAAGRYIVLHDGASGEDYVYMHMSAVDVASGDHVGSGDRVGEVGQTGDATACHLHFERWTEPGWYEGGHAEDPMPLLRSLTSS